MILSFIALRHNGCLHLYLTVASKYFDGCASYQNKFKKRPLKR
jgi:hypothetical protein